MVAERAIFFVLLPFFRFNGDAAMRTTSADISRDEQIHVATNSLVCRSWGLKYLQSLINLRKATINWVMQPQGQSTPINFWTKNFGWIPATGLCMKAKRLNFLPHDLHGCQLSLSILMSISSICLRLTGGWNFQESHPL